jgi:hypothetical protein
LTNGHLTGLPRHADEAWSALRGELSARFHLHRVLDVLSSGAYDDLTEVCLLLLGARLNKL